MTFHRIRSYEHTTTFIDFNLGLSGNNGATPVTVSIVDTVYDSCACSPVGKVKQVSQRQRQLRWALAIRVRCNTSPGRMV